MRKKAHSIHHLLLAKTQAEAPPNRQAHAHIIINVINHRAFARQTTLL